jgi:iron complex outermembrane recepter protein
MRTSKHLLKYGLFAGSALVALAGTAHADQAPAPADAPATAAPTNPGEIIVTANRRNESLQNVPMTLQALSADSLSKLNVTTFNDLLKYTPNVTFGNNGPGQGVIFMRGLSAGLGATQSQATISPFPNVALYLDDQSMQFPGHNADVYVADIERVEVLEGPQGTLFGGGAEAGAVRYITAKPKMNTWEGKMEGSFGGTAGGAPNAAFNAMINIPLVKDKLAVRAVFYDDHHGGYINNVYSTFTRMDTDIGNSYLGNGGKTIPASQQSNNGQYNNANMVKNNANPLDYVGGRVELAWAVAPDWNVLLTESYQSISAQGSFATQAYSYDYQPIAPMSATLFEPDYNDDKYWNTAWSVDGKIGDFKVIYTGAYMTRHIQSQGDYTNYARATYGTFYQCTGGSTYWNKGAAAYCYAPNAYWTDQIRTTHQSHEFRVTTPEGKRIRAILGAYYESFKVQDDNDWDYRTIPTCTSAPTTDVCVGTVSPIAGSTMNIPGQRGPAVAFGEDTQRGYKQVAFFGSADFDILPNLTLTGGTRYYDYTEYETGSQYGSFTASCYQAVTCDEGANINAANDHVKYTGFKSRAVLTWKPMPHTMLYGLFSQGFRPGGFNRTSSSAVQDPNTPWLTAEGQATTTDTGTKNYQLKRPNGYTPDSLTNWEIGFKTDLFHHMIQLNMSAYYMIWQDAQLIYFNPAAGFGNTAFATNGPTYHIKGIEAQVVARPINGLSVQGSATYNDSKQSTAPCFYSNISTSSTNGQCIQNVYTSSGVKPVASPFGNVGDTTPFSPHVQANLRGRYDWAGKHDMNWFVSGGVTYTSSMYNQPSTYPSGTVADGQSSFAGPNGVVIPGSTLLRYKMSGYALLDASFGFSRENWTFTVFGENLTNSHASTNTSSAEFIKTEVPVRPLIYGVKVSTKF